MYKIIFSCFFLLFCSSIVFSQTVYITKSGKKYHNSSCSYLSGSKVSIDLSEAIEKGFTPCSRCKPDSKVDANAKTEKKTESTTEVKKQTTTSSNQCEAITKKGNRCKRKAQTGSRYCWQHQK
jgi:methylphosphotriester-DNA--protein-cysteine methyltransferase